MCDHSPRPDRAPRQGIFPSQEDADRYRATSASALRAAQAILVLSEDTRHEIATEFGLPPEEIAVTPLGVDFDRIAQYAEDDSSRSADLVPAGRFLLSVATGFPHQNVKNLIAAYARLRERWKFEGNPPDLILVGSAASIRAGLYRELPAEPAAGIHYLGAVEDDRLRGLYRYADALVFPSVYEGFGLPILEAMAAGTPVVALPISSVPEVGGDAVVYAEGTSPLDLAIAIERVAGDPDLRTN